MPLNLQQYKLQELSKFNQLILLNEQGYIVESCDSIFETNYRKELSTLEWFPFMESIFPELMKLEIGAEELKYTKMTNPLPELTGYFDFSFSKISIEGGEVMILWTIYDYTDLYEDFIQYQQKRNELEIHRQLLEHNLKKLKSQKGALQKKNLELSDINEIKSTFYDKIKEEIATPLETLDGLTYILSNTLDDNAYHQDYVKALRISTKHLLEIVSELEYFETKKNSEGILAPFNLSKAIDNVFQTFQENHNESEIALHLSIDQDVPTTLVGDLVSFRQILYSLLINVFLHEESEELFVNISNKSLKDNQCLLQFDVGIQNAQFDQQRTSENDDIEISPNPNLRELILRLFVVKKLVELQDGVLTIKNSGFNTALVCCCLNFKLPV